MGVTSMAAFRLLVLASILTVTAALQMLFIPSKIVLDHFDTSFTPMIEFWVRGSAVGFMIAIAAILKLPTSDAHPLALLYSVACGVLYPWNAKFGSLTSGLPVKYPMHYVPELLMLGLTVAGVLAY